VGEKRHAFRVFVYKLEGMKPLVRPRHRLEDLLICIVQKWARVWTGLIWLTIGTSGRLL